MPRYLYKNAILVFLLAVCVPAALAQHGQFRNYTVEHGLSQSQVETIVQDRLGYLWAGTHHGISRFDGHNFHNFTKKDGLAENAVTSSLVDSSGRIWWGHLYGGISMYDGTRFVAFPPDARRDGQEVRTLVEDDSGNVWAGTYGAGIFRLRPGDADQQFTAVPGSPLMVHVLHYSGKRLWVGADDGLWVTDLVSSLEWVEVDPRVLSDTSVSALWEDGSGRMWIGTIEDGVFIREAVRAARAVTGLPRAPVEDIIGDGRGMVWVGTAGDGLWRFGQELDDSTVASLTTLSVDDGLSYNKVKEFALDREGNLWMALFGGGIASYMGGQFGTTHHSDNPLVLGVWSVLEDRDGRFWLGTDGGLVRLGGGNHGRGKSNSTLFTTEEGLPHNSIRFVIEDDSGHLWLATKGGGLARFDPATREVDVITEEDGLPGNELLTLEAGENGEIWIGTYGQGVVRYIPPPDGDLSRDKGRFEHYPLKAGGSHVYTILRADSGTIWVGADSLGLAEFVPPETPGQRGIFRIHGEAAGLRHLEINSLVQDHDGLIWVGASDGGLYTFDGHRFSDVGTGSALGGEHVYLVACDKYNTILAGTNYGLYRHDRESGRFTYFGREEGFWGIETNVNAVFNDCHGGVWFGTINGATRYDPDAARPNVIPPLTHITALSVFLEPRELVPGASFHHGENHVTFDFIGISLTAPNGVRYQYMLEGMDRDWLSPTEGKSATYSNLHPGNYTFKVRAANANGVWNEVPAEYSFTILAPYWMTWWFYSLCFVGVLGAVVGLYRWRTRAFVLANRQLEVKVQERTEELSRRGAELQTANRALEAALGEAEAAARAKGSFLANMSHEIRTPMNGVVGMTDLLLESGLNAEQREYADTVRKSAASLLAILNDILDLSKIEAGKISLEPIPFDLRISLEEVTDLLAPRVQDKDVELIVRYDPGVPRRFVGDAGRLRQVITNLVGNALKFTEQGHVLITVESLEQKDGVARIRVAVEDTGIGIPAEKLDLVFEKFTQADTSATRRFGGTGLGLSISRQLMEMMGGEIGVESHEGAGSTFWFVVPLPISEQPTPLPPLDTTLEGMRALVVDDNPVNRKLVGERLAGWGVRADACESGSEALAALRVAAQAGDPYAVAIIDYQMPGMDGEKLGLRIKNDPALSKTLMVMLTSVGRQGDAQRLQEVGFAGYLLKPVRYSQLYGMLVMVRGARENGQALGFITRHTLAEAGALLPRPPALPVAPEEVDRPVQARALVAEDNVVNQRLAKAILEKLGCRVELAANGREAIEKLTESHYDVVFMDCQMPEMDGYEATREIRRRFSGRDRIPIVAMTAHAMPGDREKCLDAGMDDYIAKPVRPENFEAALARWRSRPVNVG